VLVRRLIGAAAASESEADASLWRIHQLDEATAEEKKEKKPKPFPPFYAKVNTRNASYLPQR
jgi:hypothetical protein